MTYDPFRRGPVAAGVRTLEADDSARGRTFACEIWYPADGEAGLDDVYDTPRGRRRQAAARRAAQRSGVHPLVLFSHHGGGHRRAATYLCTHLASHGYVVAALDHSEVIAKELARPARETLEERDRRFAALIGSRVPDLRFLLDTVLRALNDTVDVERIGALGHSLGGWTVLQAAGAEPRIRAVVALAPGGAKNPKPGILPLELRFDWGRPVPTLFIAAQNDVSLPLEGMKELFARAPQPKQLFLLPRADHLHFVDGVEEEHEAVREMPFPAELAWLPREMRPMAELQSGEEAHRMVRGFALAWFDAFLKRDDAALRFLSDQRPSGS
jgi:predicted dienelactone hydrolase